MNTTHVQIITLEQVVYSGDVEVITLPGAEGQLGILANHASLMSILDKGTISLKTVEGTKVFSVDGGFVEVNNNSVTILADSCEAD
jgi:F-type H+-transporting ATPase subunit epsilon